MSCMEFIQGWYVVYCYLPLTSSCNLSASDDSKLNDPSINALLLNPSSTKVPSLWIGGPFTSRSDGLSSLCSLPTLLMLSRDWRRKRRLCQLRAQNDWLKRSWDRILGCKYSWHSSFVIWCTIPGKQAGKREMRKWATIIIHGAFCSPIVSCSLICSEYNRRPLVYRLRDLDHFFSRSEPNTTWASSKEGSVTPFSFLRVGSSRWTSQIRFLRSNLIDVRVFETTFLLCDWTLLHF